MVKAEAVDKETVLNILSSSFGDNLSVNLIVRQDQKKEQRIRALMDYSFEVCYLFGEVWLSEDKRACALILYPHKKRLTIKSILLDINLIFRSIGLDGISKALKREAKIKKLQPNERMTYLWFLGVDPEFQHTGIGSKLLTDIIANSTQKNFPIYLETSTMRNLPWYIMFGFQIYNRLELGYTLFFFKREPGI